MATGYPTLQSEDLIGTGLDWIEEVLAGFDVSGIERFVIRRGDAATKTPPGVWGHCSYPRKGRHGYELTCSLKGPFPVGRITRKSPLYRGEDGAFPPVPKGCLTAAHCMSTRNGHTRYWIPLYGRAILEDEQEAIVWVVAHAAYHYLRRTRQVPGRNDEIMADAFADRLLECYREHRAPREAVAVETRERSFQ